MLYRKETLITEDMKDSTIVKGSIYLWVIVFYGFAHGEITMFLDDNFTGIFTILYTT